MRALRAIIPAILVVAAMLPMTSGAAAGPSPALARRAPTSCRELRFDGEPYGLLAKGVGCGFARRWARTYQLHGRHPDHWSCVGREPGTEEGACHSLRRRAHFVYYAED